MTMGVRSPTLQCGIGYVRFDEPWRLARAFPSNQAAERRCPPVRDRRSSVRRPREADRQGSRPDDPLTLVRMRADRRILETPRLLLRPPAMADVRHLQQYSVREEFYRYIAMDVPTPESVERYLATVIAAWEDTQGKERVFAVQPKHAGRIAGLVRNHDRRRRTRRRFRGVQPRLRLPRPRIRNRSAAGSGAARIRGARPPPDLGDDGYEKQEILEGAREGGLSARDAAVRTHTHSRDRGGLVPVRNPQGRARVTGIGGRQPERRRNAARNDMRAPHGLPG